MHTLKVSTGDETEDQSKLLEKMKHRFSATPLLTPLKKPKNKESMEEPLPEFDLEGSESIVQLITGCKILSNTNDMEKAEETYTDQVLTLATRFRKQMTKGFLPSDASESEKETTLVANKADNIIEIDFSRIEIKEKITTNPILLREHREACTCLIEIINLRSKYLFSEQSDYENEKLFIGKNETSKESTEPYFDYSKKIDLLEPLKDYQFENKDGIFEIFHKNKVVRKIPCMAEFINDLAFVVENTHNSVIKSFCNSRLEILDEKFRMHLLFNREKEMMEQQSIKHRDFYNIRKVDTHIHHSACMRAKHLLRFMRQRFTDDGDREVLVNKYNNSKIKLKEVMDKLNLNQRDLNLDSLSVQADASIFERFDRFNNKYNPLGQSDLREIFLKTDNFIRGQYLAEITKQVMKYLEKEKYCYAEWRISIYGKSPNEWQKLAQWFSEFKVCSHFVRWMIQIPRLYSVYKKAGVIKNFQEMLDNLFKPLFEVTLKPETNPDLYRLLFQIVGFDTVDDESIYETLSLDNLALPPSEWSKDKNPHYAYWIYYFYANLYYLNILRKARGLNTFTFRPHCGESGNVDHLATAFMVADGINHGIKLNRAPVLQYLYYLKQIGIAMSPLSNNKLFLQYSKNPFPQFFARGLNVSLSTDDPLIIHLTKEPLVEEYAVAAQVWNLSSVDLAEIARYSVFQCSFEDILKKHWVSDEYNGNPFTGNDPEKTNLPHIRLEYRREAWEIEKKLILQLSEIKEV